VAFDHRAHGESDGRRTSFGWHEAHDVAAVLDLLRTTWPGQPQAALGIGMGAAALCFAARRARRLDAIVLDTFCSELSILHSGRLAFKPYPTWFRHLSRAVLRVTEQRLGFRFADLVPARHVGNLAPAPLLFVPGVIGQVAPQAMERLAAPYRGAHASPVVSRPCRRDMDETEGPGYQEAVLAFLEQQLFDATTGQSAANPAA
jgi:pimeloyl-ACP methyl ester carboxylesterase